MATLKANGCEIFRYSNIRADGTRGSERRVMLSGKILQARPGGGFKVIARLRKGLTFGEASEKLANGGLAVNWQALAEAWWSKKPQSTRKRPNGTRPGILHAMLRAEG